MLHAWLHLCACERDVMWVCVCMCVCYPSFLQYLFILTQLVYPCVQLCATPCYTGALVHVSVAVSTPNAGESDPLTCALVDKVGRAGGAAMHVAPHPPEIKTDPPSHSADMLNLPSVTEESTSSHYSFLVFVFNSYWRKLWHKWHEYKWAVEEWHFFTVTPFLWCVCVCVSGVSARTHVSPSQKSSPWSWSCRPVSPESPSQGLIGSSDLPMTCGAPWVWPPSKSFTSPAQWWRETALVDVSGEGRCIFKMRTGL